jgi:Serpin (serine protease inhibitor)
MFSHYFSTSDNFSTPRPPRTTTFPTVNTFRPTLPSTTTEEEDTTTDPPPTTTYPPFFAAVPAAVLASNRSARLLGGYRKRQPLITLDPTPNWRPKRYIPHATFRVYDHTDNHYPYSIEAEYYVEHQPEYQFILPEDRIGAYYPSVTTTTSRQQQNPPRNEVADIEHFFYLDGMEKISVPFRNYNTILYHAYVPAIQSDVVKFELDSEDYNLMIVLPKREFGLDQLLAVMQSKEFGEEVSLRRLNEKLERKWVRAQLPKFNLKGNVLFTNDMQKVSGSWEKGGDKPGIAYTLYDFRK